MSLRSSSSLSIYLFGMAAMMSTLAESEELVTKIPRSEELKRWRLEVSGIDDNIGVEVMNVSASKPSIHQHCGKKITALNMQID